MFNQSSINDVSNNRLGQLFTKTYAYLTMSVAISCLFAYIVAHTPLALMFAQTGLTGFIVMAIILLAEFSIMFAIQKQAIENPSLGLILLGIFSAFDGATFSFIGLVYSPQIITMAFAIAVAVFASMSAIGYLTRKKDMSNIRRTLYGMAIALLVVMFVEFFIQSVAIFMFFSAVGVLIFSGLSLVDTNYIARLATNTNLPIKSIAIAGALNLYIDFENLFIFLLNIFGFSVGNRN